MNDHTRRKPPGNIVLPALSPPMISADDAARFAHEAIGNKRDKEYGGLILQGESGRFFATLPIGGNLYVDFTQLLAVDAQGNFIHPDGYTCHGLYHSHPNVLALVKKKYPGLPEAGAHLAMNFFTDVEKAFMLRHRGFAKAFYLSGAETCLLKYEPSGSPEEDLLAEEIRNERPTGTFYLVEEIIDELARAGRLSMVIPNTLWGNVRGQFVGNWIATEPVNKAKVPTEQPFCSPIDDQPDELVGKFVSADSANADVEFMGAILKAQGTQEYVATFPWRERTSLAAVLDEFPRHMDGGPRLPAGFHIDGFYAVTHAKPAHLPAQQDWLYKNFFAPFELAALITQSRRADALRDPEHGLTLYKRTHTKALLSYTCSGSEAETALMEDNGETLQKALKAGTLTTFEFVLQVAAAGRLMVVQDGNIWDKTGQVGPGWEPFERIRQSLSPAFLTADDAARHAHFQMNSRRDIDQLGYILERDGKFFATTPVDGKQWQKDWGLPFADGLAKRKVELPGYRYEAVYNATEDIRARLKAMQPDWSAERIALHTSLPNLQHLEVIMSGREAITTLYNSGPDESLVKYVRVGSQQERNFAVLLDGAVKTGVIDEQLDGFDATAETLVRKLAALGELTVLNSSAVWKGSRGKVPGNWVAYQPYVADGPVHPALSWVMPGVEVGAQWAHDLMREKPVLGQVAFIVKQVQTGESAVTEPVVIDAGNTAFGQALLAFAGNKRGMPALAAGYEVQGICYQPVPDPRLIPAQKWLYESFISATDFSAAIGSSRQHRTAGLALYLSTRDGARLRYEFSGSMQESRLHSASPDGDEQRELEKGTLTSEAFIWRVAAVGALSVIQPGTLWDVEGAVGTSWHPFARYPQHRLSPAFLTADDAARYAHEQIGNQRDYEFCGYVMEREDGRFVATESWVVGKAGRFSTDFVYPADAWGKPILPEQHVLRGVYASRLALSMYDAQRMKRHGWGREQASIDAQLFSDTDLHAILQNAPHAQVAYLSCAEDALIAYDLSGSAAEKALMAHVTLGENTSPMAKALATGAQLPEDVVKQLAAAGGLRVLLANELWGSRGMVAEYWKAFAEPRPFEAPEQVAYGSVFASAEAAALDAHRRSRHQGPDQTCFAFVLKHEHKDEYVVSESVPASPRHPLFSQASLFRLDDAGTFVYPASFKLFGLFYARQWLAQNLAPTEQWLGRHFLSSSDLYSACFEANRLRDPGEKTGLPVYVSTLDRALLKFQSPSATTLFDASIQPSGEAADVHTQLKSGQLSARDFVSRVIARSWLTVVEGNDCWGPPGPSRLGAHWKPFAGFIRRRLSPAFSTQADAVRFVERRLGAHRDQLQGGLVLVRTDGLFVATEPLPVVSEDFDPKWILPDEDVALELLAPGCKVIARYRSRVATPLPFLLHGQERQVYRDFFSTPVLATALASGHLWTHEYLLGAEGSILSFSLHDPEADLLSVAQKSERATRLATLENQLAPSSDNDPWSNLIERRIRSGASTPVELVDQLVGVGRLEVVQSSHLWGPALKLGKGWRPLKHGYQSPASVRFASADRSLSPAFCHADDAVRHVHEQAGEREHWRFGLVLVSSRLGHAVASLPVVADDLKFPHARVFQGGRLPSGYSVRGICLYAPARQPDELPRTEVFRSFIPPTVLAAALSAAQRLVAGAPAGFEPLYLSCADGALLKYQASAWDSDLLTHGAITAYVKSLQGDGNPADYIRKIARGGQLEVLVRSAVWATGGRVGPAWSPGKVETTPAEKDARLALGPLCAHPDDAARWAWQRAHGRALLGAILRDGLLNFVATEPLEDAGPTVPVGLRDYAPAFRRLFIGVLFPGYSRENPGASKRYPDGYEVMGVQQLYKVDAAAQPEQTLYRNFVDHDEIRACIAVLATAAIADSRYYLTPRNGALLVYRPSYLDAESRVLLDGWSEAQKLSQVLDTLIQSGRLDILEPDEFWRPRGRVTTKRLQEISRRSS